MLDSFRREKYKLKIKATIFAGFLAKMCDPRCSGIEYPLVSTDTRFTLPQVSTDLCQTAYASPYMLYNHLLPK